MYLCTLNQKNEKTIYKNEKAFNLFCAGTMLCS